MSHGYLLFGSQVGDGFVLSHTCLLRPSRRHGSDIAPLEPLLHPCGAPIPLVQATFTVGDDSLFGLQDALVCLFSMRLRQGWGVALPGYGLDLPEPPE
jgi:hypothetical protein